MNIFEQFKPLRLSPRVSVGLLILRLVAGLAFVLGLAAFSEFGGGLAWILGLLTPLASVGLACTMAVAVWMHAIVRGDPFVPSGPGGSYELASIYFCIAILLLLAGPGRFSMDRVVFGKRLADRETLRF
jgi:putative oxidoreductase